MREPYKGPQYCRPPEYWDGATCGDCKHFGPKTNTCCDNPASPTTADTTAYYCFLWAPRKDDNEA